ncbi:PH domain-containing protein [Halococcus thailandensis]|uniref:Membrane-flanked domain-containing protein n=1 Tax=Halococcus thailandensis JCM 13552 TaxID=1227457 RepID=M0N0Q5_9EURY|nr:PH domain-containing protein [Halococcus thailandensis]EMA51542.1 membrane-flanked domain-containing protein [Halococcus thailandensis JCM 13552]
MSSAAAASDWVHLTGEERVLWAGMPSLYPAIPTFAVAFVLSIFGVWLFRDGSLPLLPSWFALVLVPFGALAAVWAYLSRWSTRYVFTTKAIYEKRGVLSRTVTQIRFDRIQNTAFEQSLVERTLSYGDIEVYTAGTGGVNLSLRDVPDPKRVNALVTTRLGETARARRSQRSTDEPSTA